MKLRDHINDLKDDIDRLVEHESTLIGLGEALLQSFENGGKLLTCGNGGSAAEAAHLAEEFTGRFYRERKSLPGICLSIDGTALTCIGNDYGFDRVFSRQVESLGRPGDVLIAFTASGNSENIRLALEAGRAAGLVTGLIGGRDGGRCRGLSDYEILVTSSHPSAMHIQECHQLLLHALCEYVECSILGIQ